MWAQLAMAALSAKQKQDNKMNDLASNAITEKYSGYTGKHGNFAAQGQGEGWSTMVGGLGAGMLQDKLDAKALAEEEAARQQAPTSGFGSLAAKAAAPVAARAPAAPSRSPAAVPIGNASSFGVLQQDQFDPLANPWAQYMGGR